MPTTTLRLVTDNALQAPVRTYRINRIIDFRQQLLERDLARMNGTLNEEKHEFIIFLPHPDEAANLEGRSMQDLSRMICPAIGMFLVRKFERVEFSWKAPAKFEVELSEVYEYHSYIQMYALYETALDRALCIAK